MEDYLILQKEAEYYYRQYRDEIRKNGRNDISDDWHDKYHYSKVKMGYIKIMNNLVFELL